MKFLYVYTNAMRDDIDIPWAVLKNGHEMEYYPRNIEPESFGVDSETTVGEVLGVIKSGNFDGIISWNYFPEVSDACELAGIPYMSWLFDSPLLHVYAKNIFNSCNYIFDFDRTSYFDLKAKGINAFYLPLGVNTERLEGVSITDADMKK